MATLNKLLTLLSIAFGFGLAQAKGIELILGLIDKSLPQAASARA
ncbi:MAG: hypothetical protein ACXW4Z_22095 [Candidatus Binatia bacterium]